MRSSCACVCVKRVHTVCVVFPVIDYTVMHMNGSTLSCIHTVSLSAAFVSTSVMMSTIKDGSTPVLKAACEGHLGVVKFLVIEAEADPHQSKQVWSRV